MDLYGIKPKNEKGKYFRNNIWHWHPLWAFVCTVCDQILTEQEMSGGYFNDGQKISKTKAKQIAERLLDVLKNERKLFEDALKVEMEYYKKQNEELKNDGRTPCFNEENIKEFAEFCEQSGGFEIC